MGARSIAVVLPTLNEAAVIATSLGELARKLAPGDDLVVADGGSTDDTAGLANRLGARVVVSDRQGRGHQIREAIAATDQPILLVAHADMHFSEGSLDAIRDLMDRRPNIPGGCLGHRFAERGVSFRLIEAFDAWRARVRGISYGDQGQFFRRSILEKIGGFPDQPIMEDLELALRLRRLGRPAYLHRPVTVSGRRFQKLGYWRTIWTNARLRTSYYRGGLAACQAIYDQYYRPSE